MDRNQCERIIDRNQCERIIDRNQSGRIDDKFFIMEQDRLKREKYRKLRKKKAAACFVALAAVLVTATVVIRMKGGENREQEVKIEASHGQEIIFARLDSVKGNEITYTAAREIAQEASRDASPAAPGEAPGAASGEAPGAAPGEVQGAASGEAPDAAPSEVQGAASGEAPGTAPSEVQGAASGEVPDAAPSEVQGAASGDFPGAGGMGNQSFGPAKDGTEETHLGMEDPGESGDVRKPPDAAAGLPEDMEQQESNRGAAGESDGGTGETGERTKSGRQASQGRTRQQVAGETGENAVTTESNQKAAAGNEISSASSGLYVYNGKQYVPEGESVTAIVPVGTQVTTKLGAVTTFSRLAAGDFVALVVEQNGEEQVISAVYIVG